MLRPPWYPPRRPLQQHAGDGLASPPGAPHQCLEVFTGRRPEQLVLNTAHFRREEVTRLHTKNFMH
eukprot:2041929-Prorocentrum_lima.AAC.1